MNKTLILNKIIEYKKFKSDAEFARFLEIPPQNLSKWKSRNTYDVELLYTKCPELNPEWLLTGRGEMLKNEVTPPKPQAKSNYTDEELRAITRGDLKIPKNKLSQTQEVKAYENPKGVPLLPFDAFAGIGDDVEGINFDTIEERYVIPLFDGIKVDFMIPVRGSSMYPKYSSGDVVACRLIKDILFFQWNKVYVLDTISQGVIMKRVKKSETPDSLRCVSDNKDYDPFDIPMEDVRNIALVVGVICLE